MLRGLALSDCLLSLGPGCRCDVLDLPVSQRRQAGEHVAQICLRIDASAAAGFDDREQDRAALPGLRFADKQPVLLADGRWPDRVLDGVIVDLNASVFEIDGEHGPQGQRVVDGTAHRAAWQMVAADLEACQGAVDALDDHAALAGSHGLPLPRSGPCLAQMFFNAIEMLELQQQPASSLRGALGGLNELASCMCPACGQGDAPAAALGEGGIGAVAVALDGAVEVGGDDAVEATGRTAGGPGERGQAATG